MAELGAKYPNVSFDYRNLALGGWSADLLERTAARDVSEFYPDLIVFHVYGDNRAYERIIRVFRSLTAADIVIQTDHVTTPVEPVCATGLQLHWSPPGCQGAFWVKQRYWNDFMSGFWLPTMAAKYDLALEPRRERWNAWLDARGLSPQMLLADEVHPNARGWALMSELFTSWFEAAVDAPASRRPVDGATRFDPPETGQVITYRFEGNRIELLAAGPLDGWLTVTIDGKSPRELDGCWQDSRVSGLPNLPEWPALKRVTVRPDYHLADVWTLRVSQLDEVQQSFDFTLSSASGGPDGAGSSNADFDSVSRVVKIDTVDWNLAYAKQITGKGVDDGTTFTWERRFVCTDQPPVALQGGEVEQRHVLATGLTNGPHLVELVVKPGAPVIFEVRTYRPALK